MSNWVLFPRLLWHSGGGKYYWANSFSKVMSGGMFHEISSVPELLCAKVARSINIVVVIAAG